MQKHYRDGTDELVEDAPIELPNPVTADRSGKGT